MANPQGPVVIIYLTMFPRSSKLDNIKGKRDQVKLWTEQLKSKVSRGSVHSQRP